MSCSLPMTCRDALTDVPHSVMATTNYCYRCCDDDGDVAYDVAAQCDAVAGDDAALHRIHDRVVGGRHVVVAVGPTTLDHRVATWNWIDVVAADDTSAFVHDGVVVAAAAFAIDHALHVDRMVVVVVADDSHYAVRCSYVADYHSYVVDARMDTIACYHFDCRRCDCVKCCWLFVV